MITASFALTQTPSIVGGIGLIKMPTADVLDPQKLMVGLDYSAGNINSAGTQSASAQDGTYSYKIDLGTFLGRTKGLELGISGTTDKDTKRIKEGVLVNIKYSLSSDDSSDALHLALGLENLSSQNNTDAYMVASKYFDSGMGLHFGTLFDFPKDKFRPLGMFGINLPLGGREFDILGEAFAGESLLQVNAGFRLNMQKSFSLLVRGLNLTNSATSKDPQSYFAGISFKNPF